MTRQLASFLLNLLLAPFFVAGIWIAFAVANLLHGEAAGNMHPPFSLGWACTFLVLMALGVYLAALLAYVLFMSLSAALLSKSRFDAVVSQLPQEAEPVRNPLYTPFRAVGAFFYRRLR
jgi:hypothetical protein